MILTEKKQWSDNLGILTSILCLIHCLLIPFVFTSLSTLNWFSDSIMNNSWINLDFLFLLFSFIAVLYTGQTTTKKWISRLLWFSWIVLSIVVLNEEFSWFAFPDWSIFLPSITLIFLHVYNRKYCVCTNDHCCIEN